MNQVFRQCLSELHVDKDRMMKQFRRGYYKDALIIAVPIMVQNIITNFVSLVDNIMIGQLGTSGITAVAVSNQLLLLYIVGVSGALSGAGIFTAQYFGNQDQEGVRHSIQAKMLLAIVIGSIALGIYLVFGESLIDMYVLGGNDPGRSIETKDLALSYLQIMLFGILPIGLSQVYMSSLRELGESRYPMVASMAAVLANMVLDYVLIYGKLGLPALGVKGAGIATVIARVIEMSILIVVTLRCRNKGMFKGIHKIYEVPRQLLGNIVKKGFPIFISSFVWAFGIAFITQAYSTRGIEAVAAYNIAGTVNGIFVSIFNAVSIAIMIIIARLLGANRMAEARKANKDLLVLSVGICIVIGLVMAFIAIYIPNLYNTSTSTRSASRKIMWVMATALPICAFTNGASGTLKAGGETTRSLMIDSGFMLGLTIPIAYILSRYTDWPIVPMFLLIQYLEIIKALVLYLEIKRGRWIRKVI